MIQSLRCEWCVGAGQYAIGRGGASDFPLPEGATTRSEFDDFGDGVSGGNEGTPGGEWTNPRSSGVPERALQRGPQVLMRSFDVQAPRPDKHVAVDLTFRVVAIDGNPDQTLPRPLQDTDNARISF